MSVGFRLEIPDSMRSRESTDRVVHVDTSGLDVRRPDTAEVDRINRSLCDALHRVHSGPIHGQALLKVHIGEPNCVTRMKPEYAAGSVHFLRDQGASGIVAGDTTVAYSGRRGHKENPPGNASAYVELARRHGWSTDSHARVPFVVLDRPCTAIPGQFEFVEEEVRIEVAGIRRFRDFSLAGGFAAADFMINYAHLTLHGLAGLAGCVKSTAMGCTALHGKLRMHQSLLPYFNADLCVSCGQCVDSCPENALTLNDENPCPLVDPELCIGCGECEAVCALDRGAVTLQGEDIADWQRGKETLPLRMADYTMGLMNGRWDTTIHVLHMYAVTKLCDCVDARQDPILQQDLGFLIGRNPFAIDVVAAGLLGEAMNDEKRDIDASSLEAAENAAAYVEEVYGMPCRASIEKVCV